MVKKRVGVIGGGQLASMMASEAKRMGIDFIVQTPHSHDPAVPNATEVILASIDDAHSTAKLAQKSDVITFENEFVNLEALAPLAQQGVIFCPSLETLSPLLDKYQQRNYLNNIGIPIPQFTALEHPIPLFEFPFVLKARRHGYDGQGTVIVHSQEQLQATWKALEHSQVMAEEFIPYERELAVIAARSLTGEVVIYPVVETYQKAQVCHWVIVPADIPFNIQTQIEEIAYQLLTNLQAVGVFGIEFFLTSDGRVLVNEIAPRTHNSGHYTLDAAFTSQFAMQLQAVTGLPLGSPALKSAGAVMVNLLGYEYSQNDYAEKRAQLAAIPSAHVHWYGKTESRSGRKLGHVTVLSQQKEQLLKLAQAIEVLWYEI